MVARNISNLTCCLIPFMTLLILILWTNGKMVGYTILLTTVVFKSHSSPPFMPILYLFVVAPSFCQSRSTYVKFSLIYYPSHAVCLCKFMLEIYSFYTFTFISISPAIRLFMQYTKIYSSKMKL